MLVFALGISIASNLILRNNLEAATQREVALLARIDEVDSRNDTLFEKLEESVKQSTSLMAIVKDAVSREMTLLQTLQQSLQREMVLASELRKFRPVERVLTSLTEGYLVTSYGNENNTLSVRLGQKFSEETTPGGGYDREWVADEKNSQHQIPSVVKELFKIEGVTGVWVKPYEILVTKEPRQTWKTLMEPIALVVETSFMSKVAPSNAVAATLPPP